MSVRNIAVAHLKGNTRHQLNKPGKQGQFIRARCGSAIGFSFDVTNAGPPLCAQGCRSIEIIIVMWPFISQPAPSSPYIIPNTVISKEEEERGRRAWVGLYLLFSEHMGIICLNCFHGDQPCPAAGTFWGFYWVLVPAVAVCFVLGLFPGRWISLWLTCRCPLRDWILSTSLLSPPSALLIQMCQIRRRGKPPGLLLIWTIMEFHANKLSWLTVTVQWWGSASVTWSRRASSLSEAIMRKLSFKIELWNDKHRHVSALIG